MKKITFLLSFIAIILFTQQSYSQCTETNLGTGNNVASTTIGQSFQADCTGTLGSIGVFVHTVTTGHTLTVYAGEGTGGTNLGSVAFDFSAVSANLTTDFKDVDISSEGISLTSGSTYTFIMSGGQRLYYNNGNNAADGQLYYNGGAQVTLDLMFKATVTAAACAAPTAQATSASFGTETSSTLTLNSFTAPAGGADGYAVYIRDTNSFTAPSNGDEPTADTSWNDAGQQAVYFGTSASPTVTVTGLDPGTQYFYQVYAYNDCSGVETYETTGLNANDTTATGVLTITGLTGNNKVYDDNTTASATGMAALSGVAGGHTVTIAGSPAFTFATANVNTGITITTTGYTLGGTDAAKYTLTQPTLSADITAKEITMLGITVSNKTYDGTTSGTTGGTDTLTGVLGTDIVTIGASGSIVSTFLSENVGTGITVNTTGFAISGADAGNYTLTQPTSLANITPAPLTVTANSGLSKVYGATDPILTYTITGFVSGDVEGDLDTPASISRASGENVANYVVTPASAADTNYSVSFVTTTFGITQAALTVTANSGLSKAYGATDPTLTYTISGFVNGDVEGDLDTPVSISRASGENVANYVVTPASAADTNYSVSFVTSTFGITQAALTVTANSGLSKVYGATDPTLTYTITGFVNGDVEGDLDTPVSISRAAGENVANYVVTPTSAADSNYSVSFVTTTFGINQAALTVTANSGLSKVYGTIDPTLTYTITGFLGADNEASLDTPVSISRAFGEFVANYVVTPSSAADSNYSISFVTSTFGITQAALTVTADSGLSKVFGATDPTLTYTITGFLGADNEASLDTPVSISRAAGESVANYVVTPASAADSNYSVSFVTSTFGITQPTLTITANSGLSKVYGTTDPTLTYTITGFQGMDNEASLDTPVSISRASGENVANYVVTPAGATDATYVINFVTSTLAITPAPLTVTADSGLSKVFGATDPTLTYTITGFLGADNEASLDTPVSISRAAGENVAAYVVTPASAADTNYSISFVTTVFVINQAALTVTADSGLSKVYGTTDPTLTYTITGFQGMDNEASLDTPVSISRASGEFVANYVVTPASAADSNYSVSFVTSTFGITPTALTVTANSGLSKVYGTTDPTLTYTITGFRNGDVEGSLDTPVSISRASGENVANYVVTPASAADSNYSVSFVTTTFAITPAALTVTADSGISKNYGATDPTLTYTITGFLGADNEASLDTPVSISRAAGENVANYVITPAGATDADYVINFVTSTLAITPAPLTVTADSGLSKVYGTTDPTLTYTITGFQGMDNEASLDTPVSISRASGEFVANYVVTPASAADSNYSISFVTTTFGITQAALTVTADSGLSKVYRDLDPILTYTITGFIGSDNEASLDTPVSISRASGENVANYVVTPASAADSNYSVSFVTSTFGITPAALTVTADSGLSKVYRDIDPTFTYTITGFIGLDNEASLDTPVSISRAAGENVAAYVFTLASAADTNYSVSFVTSVFVINQAGLTITGLTGNNKVYDATTVASVSGAASLSGVVGIDDVSVSGSPTHTFATANIGTSITITTTGYSLSGTASGNYTVTQPTGLTADITAKGLTVTGLTGDDKMYDGTTVATASGTPVLSGIEGADAVTLGIAPTYTFASPNPGTAITINTTGYTISGGDSGNYTLAQPILSADINGPSIAFTSTSSSGLESVASVNLSVDLSVASPQTLTVDYAVTGGTATGSGTDYTLASGTLTFNPGSSSENIIASIVNEAMLESDETFIVTLSTPVNGSLGTNTSHTYTINNDDSTVVTIANVSANEDSGKQDIVASLSNPVQGGFTFEVFTTDGTAKRSENDYNSTFGTVNRPKFTFAGTAGETQTFPLLFGGVTDTKVEADETFTIGMDRLGNTTLSTDIDITSVATYTILNDDAASLSIATTTQAAEDVTDGLFTISTTNQFSNAVTVNISVTGSATQGTDYVTLGTSVVFPANQNTVTIPIDVIADNIGEGDETVIVTMTGTNNADVTISATDEATIIITDDDAPVVTSVIVPTADDYKLGEILDYVVTFSTPVNITGTPSIALTIGSTTKQATLFGTVTNSITATFRYVVSSTDFDDDGIEARGSINLNGGIIVDALSNINAENSISNLPDTPNVNVDGVVPNVSLGLFVSSPINQAFQVQANFSELVTNFDLTDVVVTNGVASIFNQSNNPTRYTFIITPTTDGEVTIRILSDVLEDLTGNPNGASNVLSIIYDQTRPVIAITSDAPTDPTNASFIATFTVSEDLADFEDIDVQLTNANISNFVTINQSLYTATITPITDGLVVLEIPEDDLEDNANNGNEAASFSIGYDIIKPTTSISAAAADPINAAFNITVTFSEDVTGFDMADITVGNGTASVVTMVSATVYTATITPTIDGTVTVDIAADVAQDAATNGNNLATQFSIEYDATNPTLTITSTVADPTNAAFMVTITFDEDVTGFVEADITVGNGTTGSFTTISATEYTAMITPTADGNVTVDVAAALAIDAATNPNDAATQFSVVYDFTKPDVTITAVAADPINAPFTATVTFTEDVTGFVESDITVGNGTTGSFTAVSATEYTVEITPTIDGTVTIDVAQGVAQDAATNTNNAATQFSIEYDGTNPTAVVSSTVVDPTNAAFMVTFTFSEDVTGFDQADITVSNGTAGVVTPVSTTVYTAMITPTADGIVTVELVAGVAQDAATNGNDASNQFSVLYDATNPTAVVSSTVADPTNAAFMVTFTFSEDVTGFEVTDLSITNGVASDFTAISASVYTATITPTSDGIVTVELAASVAVDASINDNIASNQFSVLYDATNPVPTISSTSPNPTNTTFTVAIDFTEDVFGFEMADLVVTNGTASDFQILSATEYSALITATVSGPVFVDIPAGVTEDLATNPNDSASFEIEFDNIPPIPPSITHVSDYTCVGNVTMTGDNTLEISGIAEENSQIEVFEDGVSIGITMTTNTGFFTFDHTGTTLADGTYNFTVTATDIATNTSAISGALTITINSLDTDGDGLPDFCDDDDDGNGVDDTDEDCDGDGIIDSQDTDNSACASAIIETKSYGFSPNGDGVNDGWVIEGITSYPNSVVQVFNRSGKLAFKKKGYQNDWDGISNQISNNGTGTRLPVGPYLFIIDLGNGSTPTRGWIYINY